MNLKNTRKDWNGARVGAEHLLFGSRRTRSLFWTLQTGWSDREEERSPLVPGGSDRWGCERPKKMAMPAK